MARLDRATRIAQGWDRKLADRGHRVAWSRLDGSAAPWYGSCRRCHGEIQCGIGRAKGSLQRGRCRR